jgi:hypothetical protein
MPPRSAVAIHLGLDEFADAQVDQLSVAVTLARVQLGPAHAEHAIVADGGQFEDFRGHEPVGGGNNPA